MQCEKCGDQIMEADVRYTKEVPVDGGGLAVARFCSVECINREEEFTEDEIESLLRSAGYGDPPEPDYKWEAVIHSGVDDVYAAGTLPGEHFLIFEHTERHYDIEVYYEAREQLWEVVFYTYDETDDGEKVGLEDLAKRHTGVFQRALHHAENYMEQVENGEV